jgi:tetratricopeptide (TPR) repeat protein
VKHLTEAVKYQPNYVEAHLALGDALRHTAGNAQAALTHYQEAVRINPRSAPARLGVAIAQVALGRDRDARDGLSEATRLYPDRREYAVALARLLAAAPDDRVRDGRGSLALSEKLLQQQKSTDVGEAMAMALAELGRFDEAVRIQRDILAAAEKAGLKKSAAQMAANLRQYEHRQPCRQPWANDVPVLLSESPVPPEAAVSRQ